MNFNSKSASLRRKIAERDKSFRMTLDAFREWLLGMRWADRNGAQAEELWRCAYCREMLGLAGISLDHDVPLKYGGRSVPANFAVACKDCNSAKGELGGAQFRELLMLMSHWPAGMRSYVLRQLKAMPVSFLGARKKQREIEKELRRGVRDS